MDNILENIEDKINKLENRIINIEIQQNTQRRKRFKICKRNNWKNGIKNNI